MGQTLSLNTCLSGGSQIRVMKTGGDFATFEFPCVCAEVMVQHPGFIVVHCTPVSKNTLGGRSKITIVVPDQPLLPGQPYMLYPVPEKYKKTLASSKSFAMIKTKIDGSRRGGVTIAERRQGRRKALKMILTRLNLATFVANKLNGSDNSMRGGMRGDYEENEEEDQQQRRKQKHSHASQWAPLLSPVPESPLGFHTIAESPAGLYKMDGVPRTPLAVGKRPQQPNFISKSSRFSPESSNESVAVS